MIARLELQNELNALRAAKANLAAAQAQLTQSRNHYERQETLLSQGWTTRANYDQAKKGLQTAQSQVDAAEAQLKSAHDLVSFTEIRADTSGVVTVLGPSAGEVVQAGQMIIRLARKDGRDAVFDVPAQVIRSAPDQSANRDRPDRRSQGHRARTDTDRCAAGQSGHAHVRSQGRPDRPSARRCGSVQP